MVTGAWGIGAVAQFSRAARWQREGRECEPLQLHQFDERNSAEERAKAVNRAELLNLWHGISRRRYPGSTWLGQSGVDANATRSGQRHCNGAGKLDPALYHARNGESWTAVGCAPSFGPWMPGRGIGSIKPEYSGDARFESWVRGQFMPVGAATLLERVTRFR